MRLLYSVLKNEQTVTLLTDEVLGKYLRLRQRKSLKNIHPWLVSDGITNSTDLPFGTVNIEISWEASESEIKQRSSKIIISISVNISIGLT